MAHRYSQAEGLGNEGIIQKKPVVLVRPMLPSRIVFSGPRRLSMETGNSSSLSDENVSKTRKQRSIDPEGGQLQDKIKLTPALYQHSLSKHLLCDSVMDFVGQESMFSGRNTASSCVCARVFEYLTASSPNTSSS